MRIIALKPLAALALATCISFCGLALTGCGEDTSGNPDASAAQNQDNCYGDDLPAINTGAADEQDNCYGGDLPVVNNQA